MQILSTKGDKKVHFKGIVYGEGGAGKTYLATTWDPERVLYVAAEGGENTLKDLSLPMVRVNQWKETKPVEGFVSAEALLKAFVVRDASVKDVNLVFFDGAQLLQSMCLQSITTAETPQIQDWGTLAKRFLSYVETWFKLPVSVVWTVLSERTELETTSGKSELFFRPAWLGQGTHKVIQTWLDFQVYLEIKNRKRQLVLGGNDRVQTKIRSGAIKAPDVIEPDLKKLFSLLS